MSKPKKDYLYPHVICVDYPDGPEYVFTGGGYIKEPYHHFHSNNCPCLHGGPDNCYLDWEEDEHGVDIPIITRKER